MTQNNSSSKRSPLNLSLKRKSSQLDSEQDDTSLSRERVTAKSVLSPTPLACFDRSKTQIGV